MEIQDRIAMLIKGLALNTNSFAVKLGVPNATITGIVKGAKEGKRNVPGSALLAKICETFPETNLDWLVLGVGSMFRNMPLTLPKDMQIVKPDDEVVKNLLSQLEEYKQREAFFIKQNSELSETVAHLVKH